MSTITAMILQGFHNLNGITIGDRSKELYVLLGKYQGQIQTSDADYLVQSIKPATYLEQKFFLDIIIHFKLENELLHVFLSGDEKLIHKLWKQKWFFEKLLRSSSVVHIVNEIFPQLSYVSRIRFLKNMILYIKDEEKLNEMYDVVLEKYGMSNAQYILAGCSLQKILLTLSSGSTVNFSNKQLIFLHKKNYLQQLISINRNDRILDFYNIHSKAFNIIAGSDFNIFLDVFKHQQCSVVGKRLTKKLLKMELSYVLENASDIYKRLHNRTLFKNSGANFEHLLFSTWPSSFSSFRPYDCWKLKRYFPKQKYIEILQKGLQQIYNTSLSEHPELISNELLEVTENIELRVSLLELKMAECNEEYTLPKYYDIDRSIPILKKKISSADGVRTRENLIVALVNTCKINNDINALLKVQEYFNFRHKNDDESIKSAFLSEINNCFDLASLSEAHWSLIMDLIKWIKVKNEHFWERSKFFMLHIKFLFKNSVELSVIGNLFINNYLEDILNSFTTSWKLLDDVPILQGYLLNHLLQLLPSLPYEENVKCDLHFEIFDVIQTWNGKNPLDSINWSLNLRIKEAIKTKLKEPCRSYSRNTAFLKKLLKRKIRCEDEGFLVELDQLFWENISDKFEVNIIEYYLRKYPQKIVEHFDAFISSIDKHYLCDSVKIWCLVKHYDHILLVEKVIKYIMSNKQISMYGPFGIALATLMKSEEYTKLMTTNKAEMLDVDNEEQVLNHQFAIKLLQKAKYNDSFSLLSPVVQFCSGDSLHEALPALYYYFQHSPEKYLLEHLQILYGRAVSVRKHALKLACLVSPVEIIYNLIHTITEQEKNNSVLEHVYWKTFKYFRMDKSERFWVLIQLLVKSLDILASNAFKESCDTSKVPKNFRLDFLNFVWKLLDEKEKQGHNILEFKESIIRSITPEMFKELPYEFSSEFIKNEFMKFGSKSHKTAESFALKCLEYSSVVEPLITDICNVISDFKKNYILNADFKISRKSYCYIESFLSYLFYMNSNFELSRIEIFFTKWLQIFTPVEDINNYIRFTLLVKLKKTGSFEDYVHKVAELYIQFLNDFGVIGMESCFRDALSHILPKDIFSSSKEEENLYKLALGLAEMENDDVKLFAISLIPKRDPESSYCIEIQQKLLNIFKNSNNTSILINYNLYLRN